MKKTNQIRIRVEDDVREEFQTACEKLGTSMSSIILDLCKAAIPYINEQCKDGRWRPPALVDEVTLALLQAKAATVSMRDVGEVNHGGKTGKVVKKR